MSSRTAELIYAGKAELAEGPVWHEDALWWVNINAGTLNRLEVSTGLNTSRATGDYLGVAVPTMQGDWLIARRNEVSRLNWATGEISALAKLPALDPQLRFNDGKCDPRGRFFVGNMRRDLVTRRAKFYRLEADRLIPQFDGVTVSNGLDWPPDHTRLYYADSPTNRVDVFDYNVETGGVSNRRPLVELPVERGVPDGLCCDANGNLWVSLWGGGGVECFDGLTGKSLDHVSVPARQVSSCCFGGANLDRLYITTAWEGYEAVARDTDPLAGGIFAVDADVRGQPVSKFVINPMNIHDQSRKHPPIALSSAT